MSPPLNPKEPPLSVRRLLCATVLAAAALAPAAQASPLPGRCVPLPSPLGEVTCVINPTPSLDPVLCPDVEAWGCA